MKKLNKKVANLLGVRHCDETDSCAIKDRCLWQEKRNRLLVRRCGKLTQTNQRVPGFDEPVIPDDKQQEDCINEDDKHIQESQSKRQIQPRVTRSATQHVTSPLTRTNSDTAIQLTPSKPIFSHYPHAPFKTAHSQTSLDLTDFNALESVSKLLEDVLARNQPKRAFGMGLVGSLLSRKFRNNLTYAQLNEIYGFNDHRPYFTYWVTTVQILIMIITLVTYGFGPINPSTSLVQGIVYVSSLTYHNEAYQEKGNIWLGPRPSDLIHLGAKFTPCMRKDSLVFREIESFRDEERLSGCCIWNDLSGCLQTKKQACPSNSKWHSWNETSTSITTAPMMTATQRRRRSGPVCGQDPQYCLSPISNYPHEWPDDITKWPICQESVKLIKSFHHMSCEVVGRPCCIGIYGQCRITTSEHCQFLRGTFHPQATLCSQVSCMEDVCGMIPFYAKDYPDQFYRVFTALFLHAGLLHLILTILIQYYIMRDIERLLGPSRMAIIYILSGVAGYLASAVFVPYHTQAGPSGSQFALLACLMAETINSWDILDDPVKSLNKLIKVALALFMLGLLPWVDNYAHIFGFITGLLLSLALTPYLTIFSSYSYKRRLVQVYICLALIVVIFIALTIPLYVYPLYKCSWCKYLDCLPLITNWCEDQDIKVLRLNVF